MPTPALLAAVSVYKSVGYLVAVVIIGGFLVYALVNVRRGRAEIGAELELAANRKPYVDDEQLEGRVLDRALTWGLILLGVIALTLPLYWLNEPGRQEGAVQDFNRKFTDRGSELFATTQDGGLNCAGCHGPEGVGGDEEPLQYPVGEAGEQEPVLLAHRLRLGAVGDHVPLRHGGRRDPLPLLKDGAALAAAAPAPQARVPQLLQDPAAAPVPGGRQAGVAAPRPVRIEVLAPILRRLGDQVGHCTRPPRR